MNPVPDRKKLRREYLPKDVAKPRDVVKATWQVVGGAWARSAAGLSIALCAGAAAGLSIVLWVGAALPLFVGIMKGRWLIGVVGAFGCLLLAPVFHALAKQGVRIANETVTWQSADTSTLPAEEILVRGAAEPSAPSETLLRAGVKDEEARTEELLRSTSQGG
jgi:hypothetical protein